MSPSPHKNDWFHIPLHLVSVMVGFYFALWLVLQSHLFRSRFLREYGVSQTVYVQPKARIKFVVPRFGIELYRKNHGINMDIKYRLVPG